MCRLSECQVEIDKIKQCNQSQDSAVEQLKDLIVVANKLGMYHASDIILSVVRNITLF